MHLKLLSAKMAAILSRGRWAKGKKQAWDDGEFLLGEVSITPFCQT